MSGLEPTQSLLDKTTAIAAAYLGKNAIPADSVPNFLKQVFATLSSLGASEAGQTAAPIFETRTPAVSPEDSITDDYIICLEDGKKLRMLKRYLMTQYGLTPTDYRKKWGLPADYPMSAPAVSKQRSKSAASRGLGRRPR